MSLSSLLKTTPELLAEYLNFSINFAKKPRATLQPYEGKGSIDSKLTRFVLLSVALSFIIALIASKFGVAEDPSPTLAFIHSFDPSLLPIVAIVLILAITILFHLAAQIYISLNRLIPGALDAHLGGSVQDSINASFGFAAFFVPLTTIVLSVLLILANQNSAVINPMVPGTIGIALAVVSVIYYPAALSATHPNTSFLQAFLAVSASLVVIFLLRDLLERLFQQ